ncbi:steroid delta-isomerase [Yersinia mollaretii]|nr:steroid delta-isomerase [Yersinia mollaretii]
MLGNKVFDLGRIHRLSDDPIGSMAVFEVSDGLIATAWFYFK